MAGAAAGSAGGTSRDRIAVIGAGQMGNGIAHVFAVSGHDVTMIDVSAEALERGRTQVGSLGSGNHFLEVQVVDEVVDEDAASAFGVGLGPCASSLFRFHTHHQPINCLRIILELVATHTSHAVLIAAEWACHTQHLPP